MRIIFKWILAFGILLLQPSAFAQSAPSPTPLSSWPVSSAPARFTIEPVPGSHPASMSWVELYLPDPKWATMPIRVLTDGGIAVGSDLLWTAPGEPVTLLFDSSSGAKQYQVYLGSNWPVMRLSDAKAGVWLESRMGNGKPILHASDMLEAWKQSSQVNGRAIVPGIFEGGNRFGPQGNLFEHLQGWFEVTAPEHLELAPISVDSSFVFVDGKEVAEWPGRHDGRAPSSGQPQGAIDLSPGLHVVDYYNAFIPWPSGQPGLMACLAVKGGAFSQWTMLVPGNVFFRPAGQARAVSYEVGDNSPGGAMPGAVPALAIDAAITGQSIVYSDIPDLGLISMQLTCLAPAPATGTVTWTFDDGSTAQGQSVQHLFLRPGMRAVRLSLSDGGKEVASLSQTIRVHPDWAHVSREGPRLNPAHEADIRARDPATLSASDLVGCIAVLAVYERKEDVLKLLLALNAKMNAVADADLSRVKDAILFLTRENQLSLEDQGRLWRALVDRSTRDKPSPPLVVMASECRLELAQVLLKTEDHTDEVRSLINAIDVPSLSGDEPRALQILRADLALATGDIAGAKKQYEALTGAPSGPDARSSIRTTAKIGQARAFLDRKDYEAAENALDDVAWQAPIEKMAPDWALTRLRLYQEQNLPVAAYLWARRLLPVVTDDGRSELLFRLTELAFAQGDNALAHKALSELLTKHPYSQEAAQAKEKWPGVE